MSAEAFGLKTSMPGVNNCMSAQRHLSFERGAVGSKICGGKTVYILFRRKEDVARRSSSFPNVELVAAGLLPLKEETTGSNPVCATNTPFSTSF